MWGPKQDFTGWGSEGANQLPRVPRGQACRQVARGLEQGVEGGGGGEENAHAYETDRGD